MTFKEVLDRNSENAAILERLFALYPEQKKSKRGYVAVLKKLRKLVPTKSKYIVGVKPVKDPDGDYDDVFGELANPVDDEDFVLFALDFTPWSEWLGMRVHPSTLMHYPELDILAHCIWEMTWHGFDEADIQKSGDELLERTADID